MQNELVCATLRMKTNRSFVLLFSVLERFKFLNLPLENKIWQQIRNSGSLCRDDHLLVFVPDLVEEDDTTSH